MIWSIEHCAWWKANRHGYTMIKKDAGKYSFDEAREIVNDANAFTKNIPMESMVEVVEK